MNIQNEKDPKYWKGKTFYYNKDDKRLFVDKYDRRGTTLNLANKTSILFIVCLLLPPIIVALLIHLLAE